MGLNNNFSQQTLDERDATTVQLEHNITEQAPNISLPQNLTDWAATSNTDFFSGERKQETGSRKRDFV